MLLVLTDLKGTRIRRRNLLSKAADADGYTNVLTWTVKTHENGVVKIDEIAGLGRRAALSGGDILDRRQVQAYQEPI